MFLVILNSGGFALGEDAFSFTVQETLAQGQITYYSGRFLGSQVIFHCFALPAFCSREVANIKD